MYEVLVTYRGDFSEHSAGRYPTSQQAQDRARHLSTQGYDKILRAWVREVREARSKN
jgi:hypothetical protein